MVRIIAVNHREGRALFESGDNAVIVDINNRDVINVLSVKSALANSSWMRVAADFEYPEVWRELAEAATTDLEIREKQVTAERKFRIPQSVKNEATQALNWLHGFERGQTHLGMRTAQMLTTETYVPISRIKRLAHYFSRRPQSLAENAGWNPGTEGFPSDERIRYGLWGGDAARAWTSKIAEKHGLLAAGNEPFVSPEVSGQDVPGNVDPNAKHMFKIDPDIPDSCLICGRPMTDPIHAIIASAFELDPECDYFGVGVDPDSTACTGLLKHDPNLGWQERVESQWNPVDEPTPDTIVILLDPDSAYTLADVLDDQAPDNPDVLPYELALMNPHEAALVAAAYPEIDWDLVDRVFEIYDSQERSANAEKQNRSTNGRFGQQPDAPANGQQQQQTDQADQTDQAPQTPKAHLAQPMDLVPDVNARIDEYLKQVEAQRAAAGTTPASDSSPKPTSGQPTQADSGGAYSINDPYSALVEFAPLAPAPTTPAAPASTPPTPDPSQTDTQTAPETADSQGHVTDVRPLYLAIVDNVDTSAVLDVVALVPPDAGAGGDVTVWKRDNGKWVPAPELLANLRGATPPPVVELTDDNTLGEVLQQVDEATADGQPDGADAPSKPAGNETSSPAPGPPGETPVAPDGSSGVKPDANPDQQRRAPLSAIDKYNESVTAMYRGTAIDDSRAEFAGYSEKQRSGLAKKGMALPDGSYPIVNVADLKNAIQAYGRAKNPAAVKAHIKKRARALGRSDLIPDSWGKGMAADTYALWGPHGEIMSLAADGGLDRNRGNAEKLRRYWVHGEGALKIGWNTPGDWYRCVSHLSKYLGVRAKGYCTLRHHEATGMWPGQQENLK